MALDCICGGQTQVVDSRPKSDGTLRRRRECLTCHNRFTTTEVYTIDLNELYEQVATLKREKQALVDAYQILVR